MGRKSVWGLFSNFPRLSAADCIFPFLLFWGTIPTFALSLYPPHSWDDTSYHLAYGKLYLEAHALTLATYVRYPVFNQFAEMLFTGLLGTAGDVASQQVSWISNVMIAIGIYGLVRCTGGARAGILACAVWFSSQLVAFLSTIAYVDVMLTLMCLAASIAAIHLEDQHVGFKKEYLFALGMFSGFAISTKYAGIIYSAALFGMVFGKYLKCWKEKEIRSTLIQLAAVTLVCCLPWFLRNIWYTGNPLFPLLPKIFGLGGIWNLEDYNIQMHDVSTHLMVARNPLGYLSMPWHLSYNYRIFGEFVLSFCPFFFIGTFLSVPFAIRGHRTISMFLGTALIFLAAWCIISQNPRYALPLVANCAVYSGLAFDLIISRIFIQRIFSSAKALIVYCFAFFITRLGAVDLAIAFIQADGRIPIDSRGRDLFLRTQLPTYTAYEFLNKSEPGNLYALYDEQMNYFYRRGTFMGDVFGPARSRDAAASCDSGNHLYGYLKQFRSRYFLVNKQRSKVEKVTLPNDTSFETHFHKIFDDKSSVIFRVEP
jgi:4-amino-4-deoxy-L-arabinose transferase-like glycosyltransferase